MATLDVSDVLLSPEFTDNYSIQRNVETVDIHGRSTTTPTTTASFGVVTMANGADLKRYPELQMLERVLSIVTKTRLQSAVNGAQPDIIIWRGDNYVVKALDPYPQYGQGFYQAIAASIDLMDVAI
jgi:hypothetical protein